MHSSRMRTVRNSSRLLEGGVPGPGGGVPGPRGVYLVQGVYLVLGGVPSPGGDLPRYSPPVDRQTGVKT